MSDPTDDLDPQAARIMSRVRLLMVLAGATTLVAIAAVLGVIGYRVFKTEGRVATEATALLPKGARVLSTAAAEDTIVVTIDVGGTTEILTFDARTLRRVGRLKFATEP
ncbi:MAG TPA: hypothetical protein VKE26_14405 [Xanthobacteraceae bacterium]|nr:hypothetical protein [Xanthobacteraceae bacterium]